MLKKTFLLLLLFSFALQAPEDEVDGFVVVDQEEIGRLDFILCLIKHGQFYCVPQRMDNSPRGDYADLLIKVKYPKLFASESSLAEEVVPLFWKLFSDTAADLQVYKFIFPLQDEHLPEIINPFGTNLLFKGFAPINLLNSPSDLKPFFVIDEHKIYIQDCFDDGRLKVSLETVSEPMVVTQRSALNFIPEICCQNYLKNLLCNTQQLTYDFSEKASSAVLTGTIFALRGGTKVFEYFLPKPQILAKKQR